MCISEGFRKASHILSLYCEQCLDVLYCSKKWGIILPTVPSIVHTSTIFDVFDSYMYLSMPGLKLQISLKIPRLDILGIMKQT